MSIAPSSPGILLVDDGELDEVARVLDAQGVAYTRLRGGQIPDEVDPPRDLLIVTPRRVERVRRGSPTDAAPGRPLRIIAVAEDSPAMRRRLRRNGLHLLIRLPADGEIWRLLIARALYKGSERREDPRVAVGSPVALEHASRPDPTTLVDLSNRGCRLQTTSTLTVGDPIEFTIPGNAQVWGDQEPLLLRGQVRRLVREPGAAHSMLAVLFDADLPERDRTRLTALINHWASGPQSLDAAVVTGAPPIPSTQLPSLPDLTLDDETDPPVLASDEIEVELGGDAGARPPAAEDPRDRRAHARGHFSSSIVAEGNEGPFVLIGRDLSTGGMRIERHPDLHVGDRFTIALHGPTAGEPIVVETEIVRDDGPEGFGLVFDEIEGQAGAALEKMVACLPDVESLEDGEAAGLGAILSEIVETHES
ncbi:MAG: PilZ domain-containing protein [Myxococcota bacterium]